MLIFLIWLLISCSFIIIGLYAFNSKKEAAFGFWANAEVFPVNNIKSYNRAMGKLWCTFGAILAVLGLPLLKEQNSPYILLFNFRGYGRIHCGYGRLCDSDREKISKEALNIFK